MVRAVDASTPGRVVDLAPAQTGWRWMPEWIGTALFLSVVGLTGVKLAEDFGNRGLRGYAMLFVLTSVYAAAIGFAYL